MKIDFLRINHIDNPLGYRLKTVTATYVVRSSEGKQQKEAQIIVAEDMSFKHIVFDTRRCEKVSGLGTRIECSWCARKRYYWKVRVWDENENLGESEIAWFETGLLEQGFQGICITPELESSVQPVFLKKFIVPIKESTARLYVCCLGVYEAYLNGTRIGCEVLAPGLTSYAHYIQYQTYDVGDLLIEGENELEVWAGDGWYKGMYGYRQNKDYRSGKQFELLADIYVDNKLWMCSDLSWKVRKGNVLFTDMYDGEFQDDTFYSQETVSVRRGNLDKRIVKERLGVPIKVKEVIEPAEIMHTTKREIVLNMGQNMVGWISFICREEIGKKVSLEFGEIMQEGCFYNQNYRTAKARFDYISDGIEKPVHARLCFYGFQYVRLTGFTKVNLEDFKGEVLYSDLEDVANMKTGNSQINQLLSNILWSQKGNFLDIPTDCPQRDEKMGWTGDAQIFAKTACLNMECYAFYRKYLNDIALEQRDTGGLVPQIVPSVGRNDRTSAAWGDAAIIIPWVLYEHYGDSSILEEQYDSMKSWLSYIECENKKAGTNPDLWQNGFHYGDWLALDGGCYHMPTGGTDVYYISSTYYYYSTYLMAKTAQTLGKIKDYEHYHQRAEGIRQEIQKEYFTANGKLCIDTQTAYIVAIVFKLVSDTKQKELIKEQFLLRLRKDGYALKTGFVGTPFLLKALSDCGKNDLAYRILLNEECPGWLYPVRMRATTMWERWDAVGLDGKLSDNGMNSLNHYANGSVQEWIYGYMAGIQQKENKVGYKEVIIEPHIHQDIGRVAMGFKSPAGTYLIKWDIHMDNTFSLKCSIPFDACAEVRLPFVTSSVLVNREKYQILPNGAYRIEAGDWEFAYTLADDYRPCYHLTDSVRELVRNPEIKEYLYGKVPMLTHTEQAEIQYMTLVEMSDLPFFLGIGTRLGLEKEILEQIEEVISKIPK